MLEVTHEGTVNVRTTRTHTLVSEYEAFWMNNGETIWELQTRFTHIVNQFLGLGKTFEDDEVNIKIQQGNTHCHSAGDFCFGDAFHLL